MTGPPVGPDGWTDVDRSLAAADRATQQPTAPAAVYEPAPPRDATGDGYPVGGRGNEPERGSTR